MLKLHSHILYQVAQIPVLFLFILFGAFFKIEIKAQTLTSSQKNYTITRETYQNIDFKPQMLDTSISSKKIYIRGRIHAKHSYSEFIPFAAVGIKGTHLWAGSDSLGFYFLDITSIADTTKKYVIVCRYPGMNTEININCKVQKTAVVNVSMTAQPSCEYYGIEFDKPMQTKSKKRKH